MQNFENILKKLKIAESIIKDKNVIVAFSGGVDSSLLLLISLFSAKNVIPVFVNGPMYSNSELEEAKLFCNSIGLNLKIIDNDSIQDLEIKKNPPDRCYYCKKNMINKLIELKNATSSDLILEGTNFSDLSGHRPGFKAIKELNVSIPLFEAKFTKDEIRQTLKYIADNIENFFINYQNKKLDLNQIKNLLISIQNKPSNPCLSSRIQYGIELSTEILKMVEQAESFLKKILNIKNLRVRLHSNCLARIELPKDELKNSIPLLIDAKITEYFKNLGFKYITIDLEGYKTGSLNI